MSNSLVIIPTYNEKENIAEIIPYVFTLKRNFDILVVDDNSPDGTAKIVEALQTDYPGKLHLLNRDKKEGLGKAYIAGFQWALANKYDYIFEMDADFSHPPKSLEQLLEVLETDQADVSVGSRYLKGKINVVNWDLKRILLSYFASIYVRLITGMPVKDTTAGFVGYKRQVLESFDFDKIEFVGYAFQIEMKYKAWKKGFKIKEIPIIFTDRIKGKSKMHGGIITEAIWGVLKMRFSKIN
ncbi:MAG TPA: polyprenol monophosphomannose synthase [Flavobacteriia bacterium]|nr:polyprenol monophosphomannose synthase [Flavobacteriia bacterium]